MAALVAFLQRMREQRRAEALALERRVGADQGEIPVRLVRVVARDSLGDCGRRFPAVGRDRLSVGRGALGRRALLVLAGTTRKRRRRGRHPSGPDRLRQPGLRP